MKKKETHLVMSYNEGFFQCKKNILELIDEDIEWYESYKKENGK